jgi:K+-sensing histidine kinase KdpD
MAVNVQKLRPMSDNRDQTAKLLSLAVHELRTPVSVSAGYLRMLLRHFGEGLTDRQRKLAEESEKSCDQITALLSDLSDLALLEAGRLPLQRAPVDVGMVLARLPETVHEGVDRGITLKVTGCNGPLEVIGDPSRLAAALATFAAATLRERADQESVVATCRMADDPAGRVLRIFIGEPEQAETLLDQAGMAQGTFDEYRGGLGFRFVLASRIIAAHGGEVASPLSARGHLALLITLPALGVRS